MSMPKSLIIPKNVGHNNNNNHFIEVSVSLADHSCFANQGDYKSTNHTTNQLKFVVCSETGKLEYPSKNVSEQIREPTKLTHVWRRGRNRTGPLQWKGRALRPPVVRQPCSRISQCRQLPNHQHKNSSENNEFITKRKLMVSLPTLHSWQTKLFHNNIRTVSLTSIQITAAAQPAR